MSEGSVTLDLAPLDGMRKGVKLALKIAGNRAAKPIRERVIAEATSIQRYGFLAASIGTKTQSYKPTNIVSVVGPKMSFTRTRGTYKRGPRKGQKRKHIPYLYSWLVDKGTKRSRKFGFLDKAYNSAAGNYAADLTKAFADELAKRNK
ncbi:hypothetical protein [Limnoglobus roseus]|uniref:HK97 gp10 family phage protein n=1 Tax=Limnoglobus roseus TaxID=2598579 RepID=A0A5C1ALB9_9BACT|nr:hypothetical protein [Limnoglobus roseus]QEL18532.1 hypothetical protein PX52LOC_05559 [Limnoglobus roseus]